jgi:ABC-type multidrug transport system ATPase subunit
MNTETAILTEDLFKTYKEVKAVDALNLSVRQGEIYGFLGRNGAGKTTTIRMLLGLITPTRGRVILAGHPVAGERRKAVAATGSLVETATFYPSLTVRENLEIQRQLTGSSHEALERALELTQLAEYKNRRAGRLSLGNKQRLALARALLHRPGILILDEPANGLDPAGIVEIRNLMRRLAAEEGVTVFISSHILSEIHQLADRIGIIHRGRLIEEFDSRRQAVAHLLRVRVSDPARARQALQAAFPALRMSHDGEGTLELSEPAAGARDAVPAAPDAARVARVLVGANVDLQALVPVEEDLEARFLRLTGGEA